MSPHQLGFPLRSVPSTCVFPGLPFLLATESELALVQSQMRREAVSAHSASEES